MRTVRVFVGRRARRVYLVLAFALVALSAGVRIRTFLLTQKIYAVINGLKQVRVDITTEEQLVKLVPYLVLKQTRHVDSGIERYYRVEVSNDYFHSMRWVPSIFFYFGRESHEISVKSKWNFLSFPLKAEYLLGWRNLAFSASIFALNGTVSKTYYDIEPDVLTGFPTSYLVVVRSVHAFWADRARIPVPVQSADDDNPQYRFGAVGGQFSMLTSADSAIGVAYTFDAPRELLSHAFELDLGCFWGIHGCDSVRQVTPLLWKDRQAQLWATEARLNSGNPCPDQILWGRVRYLLDLNIALLEIVDSRSEVISYEGDLSQQTVTDYRLKEVIRGHPEGPWAGIRRRDGIPWPPAPTGQRGNPVLPSFQPGSKFLYFSGAKFDSCRIVPATPSALSAVRTTIAAPRRTEDDVGEVLGPRM
jgi:hypothetical protein